MSAFGVHVDQENLNAREGKGVQAFQKRPALGVINTNTTKGQTRRNDGKGGVPEKPGQKKPFTVHVDCASTKDAATEKERPTAAATAAATKTQQSTAAAAGGLVLRGGKKLDVVKGTSLAAAQVRPKPLNAAPRGLRAHITAAAATAATATVALGPRVEKLNLSSIAIVPRQPLKDLSMVAAREEEPMSDESIVESCASPMNLDRSLVLTPMRALSPAVETRRSISDIFEVVEYRDEIFDYLKKAEMRSRAKPYYMRRQPDISYNMRSVLVDWLVEVGEEYKLQNETLFLAVSFIDRFLSQMSVVRSKLQLLGTAAMFVASKYEEIYAPDVSEFVFITDDTYNKNQVLKMEHVILRVLTFDLSVPTILAFLSHLAVVCSVPEKTLHLAMYLCELSLVEGDPYLQYRQSMLASAAIAVARHCVQEDGDAEESDLWPVELEKASGYSLKDLTACMLTLNATHSRAAASPQQAVIDKYRANKWHNVSDVPHKQLTLEDIDRKVILEL